MNVPDQSMKQRGPAAAPSSAGRATGSHPTVGTPVNAFSSAIDPRKLYPSHFDFLMRDLFASGESPERWRIIDATETRLDEHGMEVEFTMVRGGTDLVWRRRVLVDAGRLVSIRTY